MNKILSLLAMTCLATTAIAADYSYLSIRQKDGSETFVVSTGTSFKISNENLIVSHTDGQTVFALADLSSMEFTASSAGIGSVTAVENAEVEVITLSGVSLGRFQSIDSAIASIPDNGVYLIKTCKGTSKMILSK